MPANTVGKLFTCTRTESVFSQPFISVPLTMNVWEESGTKEELLLIKKINDLDYKNSLLSDNLDLDYVEILIREKFLFGKKNEKIYILKNNDKKN